MYSERRKFSRVNNITCKVQVGKDLDTRYQAQMLDISAGGIRFKLENDLMDFSVGNKIYLQLYVYNTFLEIGIVLEGTIVRIKDSTFAVNFTSIEKHVQKELDNIILESIERGLNDMIYWGPGGKMVHNEEEFS